MRAFAREGFLYLPPALAALSVLYVTVKAFIAFREPSPDVNGKAPAGLSVPQDDEHAGGSGSNNVNHADLGVGPVSTGTFAERVEALDGWSIFLFRTLRLVTVLALLFLQILELHAESEGASARRRIELGFDVSTPMTTCKRRFKLETQKTRLSSRYTRRSSPCCRRSSRTRDGGTSRRASWRSSYSPISSCTSSWTPGRMQQSPCIPTTRPLIPRHGLA